MKQFRYISLGAGVQSTALLILSVKNVLPRADVAIFADTQDEPQWVYDHLFELERWSPIPIHRVTQGSISSDVIARHKGKKKRVAAIPAFTLGNDGRAAPLRRQCTREYKIQPIERHVRKLMGYKPRQIIKERVLAMIGISFDEMHRMRESRTPWIENRYPLVDNKITRRDCKAIAREHGFDPNKSSCVFCPYHSDAFWMTIRDKYPEEWRKAVRFDAAIRDMSMSGVKQPVFLHRSLKPLTDAEFKNEKQLVFWEECEGYCAV